MIWFNLSSEKHDQDKITQKSIHLYLECVQHQEKPPILFRGYSNGWLFFLWCIFLFWSIGISLSNLHPLPLVSLMYLLIKRKFSLFFKQWSMLIRCLLSLLFSRLNKSSSLSCSSCVRLPRPLTIFVALLWTLSSLSTFLWYNRDQN